MQRGKIRIIIMIIKILIILIKIIRNPKNSHRIRGKVGSKGKDASVTNGTKRVGTLK